MVCPRLSCALRLLTVALVSVGISLSACGQKKIIDDLPNRSAVIPDFSIAQLYDRLGKISRHHIEGIWQFPATGVEIAMVRRAGPSSISTDRVYDMIIVSSPNRAIRPGTIMGVAVPTARRGEYDAKIYSKIIGTMLTLPKKFTLHLSDSDSAMEIKPVKGRMIYNLWRLLPYLWRYAVYPSREPSRADGCVRIYPDPPAPLEPVYF